VFERNFVLDGSFVLLVAGVLGCKLGFCQVGELIQASSPGEVWVSVDGFDLVVVGSKVSKSVALVGKIPVGFREFLGPLGPGGLDVFGILWGGQEFGASVGFLELDETVSCQQRAGDCQSNEN
jgi:hypothetical protein